MEIKDWITASRKRAKITQDQLAENLGLTRGNVSAWENGRHEPNLSQIKKIAVLCNTSPLQLFGQDSAPEAKWPFSTDFSLFRSLPPDERQRLNNLVEFTINEWHKNNHIKSKKVG